MRWHIAPVFALLSYASPIEASSQEQNQQQHRRDDQSTSRLNATLLPAQASSASTSESVTSFTFTYDFVPDNSTTPTTTLSTVSVVSTYVVISTYSSTTPLESDAGSPAPSTAPAISSPSPTNVPFPISGSSRQTFSVPGNFSHSSGRGPSAPKSSKSSSSSSQISDELNGTCGGATLNVVSAHLDYWHTRTQTYEVSTISIQFNSNDSQTGWSLLPATTSFDVSTAMTQYTCDSSEVFNTRRNATRTAYDCYQPPTPIASSTSLVTIDAFKPFNQTTGNGTNIPNVATEPPKPVATLPSAAGTFTEGIPYVYFSEYEIESSTPTTFRNGSEACATATQTFLLNRLFSFEYNDVDSDLTQESLAKEDGVSGDIDSAFLAKVGETRSVTPGSWSAAPTVIVVVERAVVAQAVLAAHTEMVGFGAARSGSLVTPTPTLPPFLTSKKPTTTAPPTYQSPRIEQTADSLDVPETFKPFTFNRGKTFIAHIEHSDTTLILATPTDANVITTKIDGNVLVATAFSNVMDGNGGQSDQGGDSNNGNSNNGGNSNSGGSSNSGGNSNSGGSSNNGGGSSDNGGNSNNGGSSSNNGGHSEDGGGSNSGSNSNNGGGHDNSGSDNGGGSVGTQGTGSGSSQANNNDDDDEGGFMMFPFVAHIENSAVTLDVPAPATQDVATIAFDGKMLTATALRAVETGAGGGSNEGSNTGGQSHNGNANAGSNANGNGGSGGGFGHMVSAIANAAKPSNAAQVLSQALNQGHGDKTAAAIAAGIGAVAAGIGAGESDGSNSNGGSSGSGEGSPAQPNRVGASPGQVITVDGAAATAKAAPAFVVDGQTAVPGGAPITVDGTVISAPASTNAIVVDGSTVPIGGSFDSSTTFNVNGIPITAQPGVVFAIGDQQLQAGGPAITVDGTRLSLAPGATALIIGSSTSLIAAHGGGAASDIPQLTVGSQVITANAATQFFLAPGQTLTPGGTAIVSGTTFSLASDASSIVINGQTRAFDSPAANITPQPDIITVNGQAFAPNSGGTYLISGQTLTPGGTITISSPNGEETLSLSPSGSELIAIVSGRTITSALSNPAEITAAPLLTIGGSTFTALPGTNGAEPTYIIDGKTLTAGEEETLTIGGKTYIVSLAPQATLVEIEELGADGKPTRTRLQTLFPATATGSTQSMTGSGSSSGEASETGTGTASPAQETGSGSAHSAGVRVSSLFVAAGTVVLAFLL